MTTKRCPLRYKISSWRQLPDCLSNNSKDLHIHITDYFNNDNLRGFRISVDHMKYGTLFACILEARGLLVTEQDEYGKKELSTEAILGELEKYGFFITYAPIEQLASEQLEYLLELKNLGYDKIRIISTWKDKPTAGEWAPKVVAFQTNPLGDWLNNAYVPSSSEFTNALVAGTAINLSAISKTKQYRWDWLKDKVLNIDDVIRDNADDMIRFDEASPDYDDEDAEELDPSMTYDPE